jgi:hypothetical protein
MAYNTPKIVVMLLNNAESQGSVSPYIAKVHWLLKMKCKYIQYTVHHRLYAWSWIFKREFKVLSRLLSKSIWLPITLEVGRHKAEAMLTCLEMRYPVKISAKVPRHLSFTALGERTAETSCSSHIRVRVQEHKYLMVSKANRNEIDLSSKLIRTLNSF